MSRPLRETPFRVFFPVAALLALQGVAPWLAHWITIDAPALAEWLGLQTPYRGPEHALVQLQGFLPCLAAGFLFTMLPRRTRTAAPGPVPLGLALLGFVVAAQAGLADYWLLAHGAYAVALLGLGSYMLATLWRPEGRRPPDAFVLLPFAVGEGLLGAGLLAASSSGLAGRKAMQLGRLLVEEGVFLALLLGLGAFLVPLLTGRDTPADSTSTSGSRLRRIGYAAVGLGIVLSFLVQVAGEAIVSPAMGYRLGYGLRAAIALWVGLRVLGLHHRPAKPGSARRFAWIAFWLLPISLAMAALFPSPKLHVGFLHVLLVGSFSLSALAVATHITFGHCGRHDLRDGKSWMMRIVGSLVLLAAFTRVSADFLPETYVAHLGSAGALWLIALIVWLAALTPLWLRGAPAEEQG